MKIARRTMKAGVSTVAMGDIAFNLLIFFVILARAQDDSHLRWEQSRVEEVEKVEQARASVTVDREYRLYLNGRELGSAQLAGELEKILGDAPAGKRTVLLKIHKDTQAGRFEPILEAVSQAGGELVHVVEEEK